MVRRRTDVSKRKRQGDLSGGLLVKIDAAKIPGRFAHDARNMRFSSGAAETRPGSVRVAAFERTSGALTFPGSDAVYVSVPKNASCPLWSGLGPDFTLSFVERPVSLTPFPGPSEAILVALGNSDPEDVLTIYSTDGLDRRVKILEAGETEIDEEIGVVDDDGGSPESRRYFYHVSREGRVLRTLMVGAAAGAQSNEWTTAFAADDSKLEAAALDLFVGGRGLDGSTDGLNSKIDELRILNRYEAPNRRYYFAGHPMLEDPDLLLRLGFDEESGTTVLDDSLYGNHGTITGAATRSAGDVNALSVGQSIAEIEIGHKLHRLAVAGGVCRREQVR